MSYIMSTDDITKALYDMNKTYDGRQTWKEAFSQIDTAQNVADRALSYDYADAIASAYATNLENKTSSPYLFADTDAANDLNLSKAFDEYRKNYLSGQQSIASAYDEQRNAITSSLQTQAQNHERYRQAHYAYLQSLAENNPSLYDNADFAQYFATNNDGSYTLKGENALFGEGNYVDANGNLTELGKDFYRHMFTLGAGDNSGVPYTFQDFLSNSKEYSDLADWALAESADAGYSNSDVFYKDILGIDLDDRKYTSQSADKAERYLKQGYINENQYEKIMTPLYKKENTANDATYSFKRLGESNKDWFKLTIGKDDDASTFKLKTGKDVNASISGQLNKMVTGDSDTSPSGFDDKNPLVVYKNKMYVYVGDTWKAVDSRKDDVNDAVAAYLKNGKYDFDKRVIEGNGNVVAGGSGGFGAR